MSRHARLYSIEVLLRRPGSLLNAERGEQEIHVSIEKVLYRAHATATGGRDGRAVSSDNILDVKPATPRDLGGAGGAGTNPEQLFAAGYSACFLSALKFVAGREKVALPADTKIQGTVGIGQLR